jgi:thiol-disulfide isomerase/thioredoxin
LTALLALAAFDLGCAARAGAAATAAGPPADFHQVAVAGLGGEPHRLPDLVGARPALVALWAPWCAPCVKELPDLQRLAEAVAPCQAAVLGVAVGESPASVAEFVRARHLTYPQFTDEQFHFADALGQHRVPAVIVLDAAQRVVYTGSAFDQRARAALNTALAGAGPVVPCPSR